MKMGAVEVNDLFKNLGNIEAIKKLSLLGE